MPYTSEHRICSLSSPLGEDVLHVERLLGREAVSNLFRFELDLVSEDEVIDFDAVVGQDLCIRIALDSGGERLIHGTVARFAQGAAHRRYVSYQAVVVPWLWRLTRSADCRIYQHLSVPEIVGKLLRDRGFSDFELDLAGRYPAREYCVQYRETDFDFVSRLLEDAGISYYFRHEEKRHVLVMFDSPTKNASCPGQEEAAYVTAGEEQQGSGYIDQWLQESELRPGAYALADYNFEDPSLDLRLSTKTTLPVGGNERLEVYDYPGGYGARDAGSDCVKLRMEEEEAAVHVIRGRSTCEAFAPGYRFDLVGHYRSSFDDTYLITEVEQEIEQPYVTEEGAEQRYENRFRCLPHSIPYRPPRLTSKPVVRGVQTALVVGDKGKEIDIDSQGRVVVQFHWDREGKRDAESSCRVRVAQSWAGKGWGLVAHPRIGQEVVVEFLEGDPDRPLITGRVYNGEQTVAYASPTETGIKSRSTSGGSATNFNELKFEDKKGSELLSMQAEKDMQLFVKNDRASAVGRHKSEDVGSNKEIHVGGGHKEVVDGSMSVSVGQAFSQDVLINHSTTVGGAMEITVGAALALTAGAAMTETVGGGKAEIVGSSKSLRVASSLNETVGDSRDTTVKKDLKETVGGKHTAKVENEYTVQAKKVQLLAEDEISIKTGKAEILMKKNGDILIKGKKIDVKGSGTVVVKGSKIKEN